MVRGGGGGKKDNVVELVGQLIRVFSEVGYLSNA